MTATADEILAWVDDLEATAALWRTYVSQQTEDRINIGTNPLSPPPKPPGA